MLKIDLMKYIKESVSLPVSEKLAFQVVSDVDLILRLSPYWSLKKFIPLSAGIPGTGSRFEAVIEHYGKELTESLILEIVEFYKNEKISLKIEEGILKRINFVIESNSEGVRLTHQFLLDSEDESIIKGSEHELYYWLRSIGEYLKLAGGGSFYKKLFRWFMDKVWLRMTLSERKIAIIMVSISIIEIILLLVLSLIWNLFA
jgi:hypothetical protein